MEYRLLAREILDRALLATSVQYRPDWNSFPISSIVPESSMGDFISRLNLLLTRVGSVSFNSSSDEIFKSRDLRASRLVEILEAALWADNILDADESLLGERTVKVFESYEHYSLPSVSIAPPAPAMQPPASKRDEETGSFIPGKPATATLVRVFYATDRKESVTPRTGVSYDSNRSSSGQLHFGRCEVSIPKLHKTGKLETPSILRLEFRPDPAKHIVLSATESMEEAAFFKLVASSVALSAAKDALVFVHGFNVSFDDAARRTGQIAFDLNFIGAPIFYSWPSNGHLADYIKDETNVTWSAPHFLRFLNLLSVHSGAARVHIIAHSMGNRVVCDALHHLSLQPDSGFKLNHLILAAPDIDAETFSELAVAFKNVSRRITLYESSADKALKASKRIHGNARAGEPLLIVPGLDTIDASAIDTDFLSHSYFSDTWPLLSDIHALLFDDQPPERRFGLEEKGHAEGRYFAFRH